MSDQVDILYSGIVVAKGAKSLAAEGDGIFFVGLDDPLPVGTALEIEDGGVRRPARVEKVIEAREGDGPGMRIKFLDVVDAPVVMLFTPPANRAAAVKPSATPTVNVHMHAFAAAIGVDVPAAGVAAPVAAADGSAPTAPSSDVDTGGVPQSVTPETSSASESSGPVEASGATEVRRSTQAFGVALKPDDADGKKKKKKKR